MRPGAVAILFKHMMLGGMSNEAIMAAFAEVELNEGVPSDQGPTFPTAAARHSFAYRQRKRQEKLTQSDANLTEPDEKLTEVAKEKVSHTLPKENINILPPVSPKREKGATRLGEWTPPECLFSSEKVAKLGLSRAELNYETEKFRDHFAGSGARKVDWVATWMNWMRRAAEYRNRFAPKQNQTKQGFDRAFERIRNHAASQETNVVDLSEMRLRSEGFSGAPCDVEPSD